MADTIQLKSDNNIFARFQNLNWGLIALIIIVTGIGVMALYSAAGGDFSPWASKHIIRFLFCFLLMIGIALIGTNWWYRLAWPIYFLGFLLLGVVEAMGHIGMGAQRWIDLGFIRLQPSELMKIAIIMVLARIFHNADLDDVRRVRFLVFPALVVLLPVCFVLIQPDLGTSLMIVFASAGVFFVAGAPIWIFIGVIVMVLGSIPIIWNFLHDFQKQRVLTFLNPEDDPLGAGYHITQSKIALGSGGIEGKGFLKGTQSNLNFLPEKQTDFIFTLLAEEWGLLGGLILLTLFGLILGYGVWISLRCRQQFSRLLAIGLSLNFSLYVFINIAMVMGLIPVVGAPLPLISYGGTAMLAVMIGFGLIMSCSVYRDSKVTRI